MDRGIEVHPYRWHADSAVQYAERVAGALDVSDAVPVLVDAAFVGSNG